MRFFVVKARGWEERAALVRHGARPALTALDDAALDLLVGRAQKVDLAYEPADFRLFLTLRATTFRWLRRAPKHRLDRAKQRSSPDRSDRRSETPAQALDDLLEGAWLPGGLCEPPSSTLERNPLAKKQGYLEAAPVGIGVGAAWRRKGGDGEGCRFVDVEQGWNTAHDDFFGLDIRQTWGMNVNHRTHGANSMGVILARDNLRGGVGIAHGVKWVALASEDEGTEVAGTANAIASALPLVGAGDVILLESQTLRRGSLLPSEYDDLVFEVVRLATALGVSVVASAGNGGVLLDEVVSPTVAGRVFDRSVRDSGAVIVGAARANVPHLMLDFSNRGASVDCFAWGEGVVTTGGDAGNSQLGAYNFDFGGTSSAAAIVAGAALCLQGIARLSGDGPIPPKELRGALGDRELGVPSGRPRRDRIGVMPNLAAILESPKYAHWFQRRR